MDHFSVVILKDIECVHIIQPHGSIDFEIYINNKDEEHILLWFCSSFSLRSEKKKGDILRRDTHIHIH